MQGAKLVNIDFDITVSLKQGYSVEDVKATVKDVIKSALTEYKNEWELNESTELVSIQFLTAIYNECSNYILSLIHIYSLMLLNIMLLLLQSRLLNQILMMLNFKTATV